MENNYCQQDPAEGGTSFLFRVRPSSTTLSPALSRSAGEGELRPFTLRSPVPPAVRQREHWLARSTVQAREALRWAGSCRTATFPDA